MFTRRYVRDFSTSNGLSRRRYFRPRFRRGTRFPSYSNPRRRPSIFERDRRFRDWLREKLKEREEIDRDDDGTDSETEDPDPPEVPSGTVNTKLHVKDVELHIDENTKNHHTDMYECTGGGSGKQELVVRRGQTFLITVLFDRAYDVAKNDIKLTFTLAAGEGRSTISETFKVNESRTSNRRLRSWSANVVKKSGKELTIEVFSPANTPIGEWQLSVRTIVDVEGDKDLIWQYNHNEEINILFNPWCREDTVYLNDETWRNEAVLNDDGAVFFGSYNQIGASSWHYGQFDDGVLEASLHLVRRGFNYKTSNAMGKAHRVSRVLSTMVNAPDDNGVLVGNWSDDFSGGVKPTAWTGSVKILRQYMRTRKPVKYAQCWVYSAVLTTVCRALGIPCRSLTNFESAHNTDKERLSYDIFIDSATGERIGSSDSIWNFHVWNDAWMTRPDLDGDYDGWQAIDATPQERSDGVFCCGPSPLKAIKEGDINVSYDTAFVFAEVNSDKVVWEKNRVTEDVVIFSRDTSAVGKNISTRNPKGPPLDRLDITNEYKYEEGSPKERQIVKKAERLFRQDNIGEDDEDPVPKPRPVKLIIERKDGIFVGSSFTLDVMAVNGDNAPRTINLNVKLCHKTYYGNITGTCLKKTFESQTLAAEEKKVFTIEVPVKETLTRPRDGFNFYVKAVAKVVETDNIVTETLSFRLRRPDIIIKGPDYAKPGDVLDFEISFTNPLPTIMTNVEVMVEGNLRPVADDLIKAGFIRPGETWSKTIKMIASIQPRNKTERNASFGLESDQLSGIVGMHSLSLR